MALNKNMEPATKTTENSNGQVKSNLQPPKLVVDMRQNSRDIMAKIGSNPRANLYLV